jgi:multiple sugar transport system substrate-binding protein
MKSAHIRRRVVAALAAFAVIPLLAACAGGSNATGAGAAGKVDGSTITIATISQLKTQFQTYADAYMKAYPNRKVKIQGLTQDVTKYTQQLATQRISKTLPDIFFNVDFLANTFAKDKVALDLAPGLKAKKDGLDLSSFLPQFVGQYRPATDNKQITGLPVSADSTALVYNKTLFKEAGVTEYPTSSWTLDDYYRVAKEIQDNSGGKIIGTAAPLLDGTSIINFGPALKDAGVAIYDPKTNTSDIGSAAADKVWASLIKFYGTASGAYTTTANDPTTSFESGSVAMALASRGSIPTYRTALAADDWDVAETPTVDGKHISGGGSYGLSIGATSKNQDAAWAFLAWFYDAKKGMKVAQTAAGGGIIPPTTEGLTNGTWQNVAIPTNIKVFAQTAKDAVLLTQLPGSAGTTLTTATQKAVQEVVLNGATVKDAFDEAQATVNAALKTAK